MANKNFQTAPRPQTSKPLADETIDKFVHGGTGQDNPQNHKPSNVGKKLTEPLKRLSVDIPQSTHLRFKTVCSATGKKMTREIEGFIKRRIVELEKESGITL